MIELFTGTPGSGKSVHALSVITQYAQNGSPIITNMELNGDPFFKSHRSEIFHYPDNSITPDMLIDFSLSHPARREDDILLVIDEAQIIFNSRDWSAKGRAEWISFFTQHRKYGYHIILIAQFAGMLDKQIRSIIEYDVQHRRIANFGFLSRILSLLFFNRLFIGVRTWANSRTVISRDIYFGWPWIYRLGNTHQTYRR